MVRTCIEAMECVGFTTSYRLVNISKDLSTPIWVKIEQNVTGSVYDRVIAHLIYNNDQIFREKKILAMNFVGEIRSMNLIASGDDRSIVILTTSIESGRENGLLLSSKGWRIHDLKRKASLSEMYKFLREAGEEGFHVINLWDNDTNVSVFGNIAVEILDQLGCIDYFIASIFDPSVLVGVAKVLKKECGKAVKVYGIEPSHISIVSNWYSGIGGGSAFQDPILNFTYDVIPNVLLKNRDTIDGFINVDYPEIISIWRKLLLMENLNVGYISSVNVAGARKFNEKGRIASGRVVTLLTDSLVMYMGTEYFMDQFLSKQMFESIRVSNTDSSKYSHISR